MSTVSLDQIYATTSSTDTTSSSSTSSTSAYGDALGMNAFLTMFMAQVTNQNPLDPMDNTEFTAQLATFSQLEQLTKINESMSELAGLKEVIEQGNIVNYIGRGVTLSGDVLPIAQGYVGKVGYSLAEDAYVAVTITDENGSIVRTIDLGRQTAGTQSFQWDAKDSDGNYVEDGPYQVTISAYDESGNAVAVSDQTVNALVTGYQKGSDGENYLLLGDVALPISEVLAVYYIPTSTQSDSTETETASYTPTSSQDSQVKASTASTDSGTSTGESILKTIISLGGLAAALL